MWESAGSVVAENFVQVVRDQLRAAVAGAMIVAARLDLLEVEAKHSGHRPISAQETGSSGLRTAASRAGEVGLCLLLLLLLLLRLEAFEARKAGGGCRDVSVAIGGNA